MVDAVDSKSISSKSVGSSPIAGMFSGVNYGFYGFFLFSVGGWLSG